MAKIQKTPEGHTKLTWNQMVSLFYKWNNAIGINTQYHEKSIHGVVVYKEDNWPNKNYSLESRSYVISSSEKMFIPGMGGNSIFGQSLDKTDFCRLDRYSWEVDYCYVEDYEEILASLPK